MFGGGLVEDKVDWACYCPSMQPAVCVNANRLSGKLLEVAVFVYRF